jgi:predicted phage baseplate assembly protein
LLLQDPVSGLAQIQLTASRTSSDGKTTTSTPWNLRRDLLESERDDPHFVVEMDDFGTAHLRFGDGDCGEQPAAQTSFSASYRIGNGPDGNVGAHTIRYLVFSRNWLDVNLSLCNPFPAQGGTAPEPVAQVKLLAPHAFRSRIERAVTAQDYATLAERDSALQGAAACLRWNGSWYEALVAVDPAGSEDPSRELLRQIDRELCQYRRVGHDVVVCSARYVALALAFKICVLPDYLRAQVEAALLDAFSNRLLPGGRSGFFYPDNLTFGRGVYVSKLLAVAQSVAGVESVCVTKLERLYEGPNGEIAAGILPLKTFEIARLDNDPSFPEHGQIAFDLRGGR